MSTTQTTADYDGVATDTTAVGGVTAAAATPSAATFWTQEGVKRVAERELQTSVVLGEMTQCFKERAELEAKFAREMRKFSQRWETRFRALPVTEDATLAQALSVSAQEASGRAQAHESAAGRIVNEVLPELTMYRSERFARVRGKLRGHRDILSGFSGVQKGYSKAAVAADKARLALHARHDEVAALRVDADVSAAIVRASRDDDLRALHNRVEKAVSDAKLLDGAYRDRLRELGEQVGAYERGMREQFDAAQTRQARHIESMAEMLGRYRTAVSISGDANMHRAHESLGAAVAAVDASHDTAKLRQALGVDAPAPRPSYNEWNGDPLKRLAALPPNLPRSSLLSASRGVETDGGGVVEASPASSTPLSSSSSSSSSSSLLCHGAWFTKAGEGRMSRAHSRFFLMQDMILRYFGTASFGVPSNEKGSVDLKNLQNIACDGERLRLTTPGRTWQLRAPRDKKRKSTDATAAGATAGGASLAAYWAQLLSQRTGVPVAKSPPIMVAAAAVSPQSRPEEGDQDRMPIDPIALLEERNAAATTIQAAWRGHRVRKQMLYINEPDADAIEL